MHYAGNSLSGSLFLKNVLDATYYRPAVNIEPYRSFSETHCRAAKSKNIRGLVDPSR